MIVGSGKTATDGIVWLLANGVEPDRIVWVRPRDPWMLNRAVVQPDPVVALGLAADTMAAAADAESLDDLFLRLEAAGVMLRIDTGRHAHDGQDADARHVGARPAPHHRARRPPRTHQARDAVARSSSTTGSFRCRRARSWCTAPPPDCSTRRWSPSGDRTRSGSRRSGPGFPCFNAALAGYVEATRDDDRERNRLCPPNTLPDRPADWARMQVRGTLATRSFGAEPDIAAWANGCALNPARIEPAQRDDPAVQAAAARVADVVERGLARMTELAQEPLSTEPR